MLGLGLFLLFDTTSPALENTFSHGTEEALVQRNGNAEVYKWPKTKQKVQKFSKKKHNNK